MARLSSSGPSPCIARALQRLDSAPDSSVSLAELAALSDVSRFLLLRGFAHEIGITPHAYLVQRRVRLARRLLADGQTPAQAALQAGFADQSHRPAPSSANSALRRSAIERPSPDPGCHLQFRSIRGESIVRFVECRSTEVSTR